MKHSVSKTKDRFKILLILLVMTVAGALFIVSADSPIGADTPAVPASRPATESVPTVDNNKSKSEIVEAPTEFGAFSDLGSYMQHIMKFALPLGIGLAVIMTIYGGILFMLSQGQPDKIKDGQEAIQGAILGLLVLIVARFLANFLYLPSTEEFNINPDSAPASIQTRTQE